MTHSRQINKPKHVWTEAERDTLRKLYPEMRGQDVAAAMGLRLSQVYQMATKLGLEKSEAFKASDLSGRVSRGNQHPAMIASRFQAGLEPWNKGKAFRAGGRAPETQFAKGQMPHNWRPVGSYRVSGEGQLERKMNELPGPNNVRWHPVSRIVWEAAHGPLQPDHMVVFKPGMKSVVLEEITLDRLDCITRAENARRNHPRNKSPEFGKLVQLKGAITRQVNRIKRETEETA